MTCRNFINAIAPFFGLALVVGLFSIKPEVREALLTLDNFRLIGAQTVNDPHIYRLYALTPAEIALIHSAAK